MVKQQKTQKRFAEQIIDDITCTISITHPNGCCVGNRANTNDKGDLKLARTRGSKLLSDNHDGHPS